jgi:hypothetical protein
VIRNGIKYGTAEDNIPLVEISSYRSNSPSEIAIPFNPLAMFGLKIILNATTIVSNVAFVPGLGKRSLKSQIRL